MYKKSGSASEGVLKEVRMILEKKEEEGQEVVGRGSA